MDGAAEAILQAELIRDFALICLVLGDRDPGHAERHRYLLLNCTIVRIIIHVRVVVGNWTAVSVARRVYNVGVFERVQVLIFVQDLTLGDALTCVYIGLLRVHVHLGYLDFAIHSTVLREFPQVRRGRVEVDGLFVWYGLQANGKSVWPGVGSILKVLNLRRYLLSANFIGVDQVDIFTDSDQNLTSLLAPILH